MSGADRSCPHHEVAADDYGWHLCIEPRGHDGDHICTCGHRWSTDGGES